MQIISIAALITAIINLLNTLIFLFAIKPRNKIKVVWALFSLAVAGWSGSLFISTIVESQATSLFWGRCLNHAALLIPLFYIHFIILLLDKAYEYKKFIKYAYVITLSHLLSTIIFQDLFVPSMSIKMGIKYYVNAGPLFHPFLISFVSTVLYAFFIIFKHYSSLENRIKNQIKYIGIGIGLGFTGGSSAFLLAYDIPFNPSYAILLVPVYTLTFAYAVIRHQCLDIRIVIKRSLIYATTIALLSLIYLIAVISFESWTQSIFQYEASHIRIIIAFIIGLAFIPIRHNIQTFLERTFFKSTQSELVEENERLRQEMIRKERLSTVATLASGMAHEIKNPLTVIKTFTEYLPAKHMDPTFIKKFAPLITKEVDRIDDLVKQLLNYSKPTVAKLSPTNISSLVEETCSLLSNDVLKQQVTLNKHVDIAPETLLPLDSTQIKQVLLNIMLNAIDMMPRGGTLTVRLFHPNTNEVALSITDTGPGIADEDLKRVFDPFYTTKDHGTGLGLSICHEIMQQHHAQIIAQSVVGKGSTFSLIFKSRQ